MDRHYGENNSIEIASTDDLLQSKHNTTDIWSFIRIMGKGRFNHLSVPINSHEILIMGGEGGLQNKEANSIAVFDTVAHSYQIVSTDPFNTYAPASHPFEYYKTHTGSNNHAYMLREGKVVAMVKNHYTGHYKLVTYT